MVYYVPAPKYFKIAFENEKENNCSHLAIVNYTGQKNQHSFF